jgi:type II restriction/modification system DNA methylase subunit YeeA
MNKSNLKSYAPQARKDFIAAVTARAHLLGLDEQGGQLKVAPAQTQGDVTLIAGQAWPAKVDGQRQQLIARMQREGFAQTVEAVAYTWFNRFSALRYMELHDYLGHGHRALSSREGGLPEILTHASELAQAGDLPGLKASQVNELKLAGNRDGELYRLLLIAQCNALHQTMPFLFERIDDETELLLPDNLLLSDAIVAKLVAEMPEEDWAEVEIIGWLYQFYISEKKDQVIGKVVKSEDIPAATQLFTPNWIVQYLVQNSVGRLWLMANPQSALAKEWPYYIQPAEQTPEVQAQLDALIQTRIREDGEALNPETITVLDPACGSGHILVVAYDVLKAIYLERGYQPRAIPRLILEKNLYGLDIDDRAAQLAAFALLMKARADDRRLFTDPPKLNVRSLQESKGLDVDELATHLAPFGQLRQALAELVDTFEHAKTFGSLIQIPAGLNAQLAAMTAGLQQALRDGDLYARQAAKDVLPLALQALVLGMQFDAVVANPPYMGGKGMNEQLKDLAKRGFAEGKSDLFSMFISRCLDFGRGRFANYGLVTPYVWMFISSYERLRSRIVQQNSLNTLVQLEYNGFEPAMVPVCAFTLSNVHLSDYIGGFVDLSNFRGHENQAPRTLEAIANHKCGWYYEVAISRFKKIPGNPIAFKISAALSKALTDSSRLDSKYDPREGLKTGDNESYLRLWHEVNFNDIGFQANSFAEFSKSQKVWLPHQKGGDYRRWYGNQDFIINWRDNGEAVKANPKSTISNLTFQLREGVTWSYLSSSFFGVRYSPSGFTFNNKGPMVFGENPALLTAYLCSSVGALLMNTINPTLNFSVGNVASLPYPKSAMESLAREISENAKECIGIARDDWNVFETSFDFVRSRLVEISESAGGLSACHEQFVRDVSERISRMIELERKNNSFFINAFELQSELSPEVNEDQITLSRSDREKDCQRLISYAIGCMMGRYSLDEPGLIYAHAGNVGFDPSRYEKKFPADADGIVPLTDEPWYTDDAASRVREFLRAVWGQDTLEENMAWLAESLGVKGSETPDETIRRYLADKFFKDHLQTYKKRPIYWLFSSGKQGAFQALVYLHRYHEGTLARLRAEYVVPLTGKMQARLDMLDKDAQAATSTAARNKISKEIEKLKKKHLELLAYDEKLRHHADMRITLDLDDGVKMNYGKFGDLLDSVKVVTGGAGDD